MKTTAPKLFISLLTCLAFLAHGSESTPFITAKGDQLMEGDKPFRFISWNVPNLLVIEDNLAWGATNHWRLPDRFELTDALASVKQMGGNVVRSYVLTVRRTNDAPDVPRHVIGPIQFNEAAFQSMDLALQVAHEQGVRLIIPFVDNWSWQGGRAEYAGFRGKAPDDFWTDAQLISDFKETIRYVLTRTNSLNGLRYCDDPTILCWETGNELSAPAKWTREIAGFIKNLDQNHLVMDGTAAKTLRDESLDLKEVDIVTTHHYPGGKQRFAEAIIENAEKANGRKPYIVGEFGFVPLEEMAAAIQTIRESGVAGGLLWSLRFHNRDGGFYWHSEPLGSNQFKAYHWPGSPIGAAYDEIKLMTLVREQAFAINGERLTALPIPEPPKLLEFTNVAAISWQGSVGASSYVVERAENPQETWTTVSNAVDESFVQYRPVFVDESAPRGEWYYRVRARNVSGVSDASNMVGPIRVKQHAFVDELENTDRANSKRGQLEFVTQDCRKAREDAHRVAGDVGSELNYTFPTVVQRYRIYAYYPQEAPDLEVLISNDAKVYRPVTTKAEIPPQAPGDYGYWRAVVYESAEHPGGRQLKIKLNGPTQIGRVEVWRALR